MKGVTDVVVSVAFYHRKVKLTQAEVSIPMPIGKAVHAGLLIDACQRSVAHCVDELQKDMKRD